MEEWEREERENTREKKKEKKGKGGRGGTPRPSTNRPICFMTKVVRQSLHGIHATGAKQKVRKRKAKRKKGEAVVLPFACPD